MTTEHQRASDLLETAHEKARSIYTLTGDFQALLSHYKEHDDHQKLWEIRRAITRLSADIMDGIEEFWQETDFTGEDEGCHRPELTAAGIEAAEART